jgi:hypothetical protein
MILDLLAMNNKPMYYKGYGRKAKGSVYRSSI